MIPATDGVSLPIYEKKIRTSISIIRTNNNVSLSFSVILIEEKTLELILTRNEVKIKHLLDGKLLVVVK